jgi:hypothetical protein
MSLEADQNVRENGQAQALAIEQGNDTIDVSGLAQSLQPACALACGQMDLLGELSMREVAPSLHRAKDLTIKLV